MPGHYEPEGGAMDMTRHLQRWLSLKDLEKFGDRYDGVIADVVESTLRNPFTKQREVQPVIVFEDGWRLVPNIAMREGADRVFWYRDAKVDRLPIRGLQASGWNELTQTPAERRLSGRSGPCFPILGGVVQLVGQRGRR